MKTDIPVFDLIDQCEFGMDNPFELENGLFPNLRNHFPSKMVDLFEKRIYNSWLDFGFIGESTVCVFYDIITEKLLQDRYHGYFDHLNKDELNQISVDFADVIEDEVRHREIFLKIIEKTGMPTRHDINRANHTNLDFKADIKEVVQTDLYGDGTRPASLLGHVVPMLIGETYLLATFNMFYNMSPNKSKKQIFKSLLQDESRHTNHFRNLLKQASINPHDAEAYRDDIHANIFELSNFGLLELVRFVTEIIKSRDKMNAIFTEVYKDKFHEDFRELFLRKIYQFYSVIYPNTTEAEFYNTLNSMEFSSIFGENQSRRRDIIIEKALINQ
jgi:rubrerythrin